MSEVLLILVGLLVGFLIGLVAGTVIEHRQARRPGHYE